MGAGVVEVLRPDPDGRWLVRVDDVARPELGAPGHYDLQSVVEYVEQVLGEQVWRFVDDGIRSVRIPVGRA